MKRNLFNELIEGLEKLKSCRDKIDTDCYQTTEFKYHVGYVKDFEFWSTYETENLEVAQRFVKSQQKHYGDRKLLIVLKKSVLELID